MEKSIIQTKSLFFAQNIFKLCQSLDCQKEYIISKQILRCGTSVGANIHEAYFAESNND
jgi:four helix bundle protein